MSADDMHGTITSNNLENLLENSQRELLNISIWMRINKLSANPKKTEYMLIVNPRKVNKFFFFFILNIKIVTKTNYLKHYLQYT